MDLDTRPQKCSQKVTPTQEEIWQEKQKHLYQYRVSGSTHLRNLTKTILYTNIYIYVPLN